MPIGVYIHIPFCKAKCLYCDFNSYAGMEEMQERYVEALCKEIRVYHGEKSVDSVYIGGGTPTVLPLDLLVKVIDAVKKRFILAENYEMTIECNPATMGKEGFTGLYQAGVNRLSIGLQSAHDSELRALGRIHTLADFAECFYQARACGFSNLSLDLMHGLPGQTMDGWMETLRIATEFQPEHISCYGLKLEEGTPLYRQNPTLPDEDLLADFYEKAINVLAEHGYQRYEISNFAKPGKESRHNLKYWKCKDYIGFGAGAYSCIHGTRYDNEKSIENYCTKIEHGISAMKERQILTKEEQMSEFCFLGLRMVNGISVKEFETRFSGSIIEVYGKEIEKNCRRGTLIQQGDRLFIPPQYLFVSNSILVDFV